MGEPLDPLTVNRNSAIWNQDDRIIRGEPTLLGPVLQEYGHAVKEDEGYQRAWAPDDDDMLIYGRTFGSPTRPSATTRAFQADQLLRADELPALESNDEDDSYHSLSEETTVDPESPGNGPSVPALEDSQTRITASIPFRTRSPRTPEEVEFLRVAEQVNPQGYAEAFRRVDVAHRVFVERAVESYCTPRTLFVQRDAQYSASADELDRHANEDLSSQEPATPEASHGDAYTGIHPHPFGSPLDPQPTSNIFQDFRSSLRIRRHRGNPLYVEIPSSTASPASSRSFSSPLSTDTTLSNESLSLASLHNRKRRNLALSQEAISTAQQEWSELSDDIQGNPAKKRRISGHLAREPIIVNARANLTPNNRSRSGSFQNRPLLRKSTSSSLRLDNLITPLSSPSQNNPQVGTVSGQNHNPGSRKSSRASCFSTRLEEERIPSISDDFVEMQANNATPTLAVASPPAHQMPLSVTRAPAALSTSPFQKSSSRNKPSKRSSTSNVTTLVPGNSRISKFSSNSRQKAKTQLPPSLLKEMLDSSSSLSITATVQPKKTVGLKTVDAPQAVRRSKRINERLLRL